MPNQSALIEELNYISGHLSGRIWTISVGVLAFCLTFIVESIGNETTPFLLPVQVLGPIIFAFLALLADVAQQIAGYIQNLNLLQNLESSKAEHVRYDSSALAYRFRTWCFCAKVVLCFISTSWLVVILGLRIAKLL